MELYILVFTPIVLGISTWLMFRVGRIFLPEPRQAGDDGDDSVTSKKCNVTAHEPSELTKTPKKIPEEVVGTPEDLKIQSTPGSSRTPSHRSPFTPLAADRRRHLSETPISHVLPGHIEPFELEDFDELTLEDIEFSSRLIGKGSFGTVIEARFKGRLVAVKVQPLPELGPEMANLRSEMSVLKNMVHPNLVQYLGAAAFEHGPGIPGFSRTQTDGIMMVMEFCVNGSLEHMIEETLAGRIDFSWGLRLRCAKDIAKGLEFLHGKEVIHRDMKSLNVVFDGNWRAKLCDYGLAVGASCEARLEFSGGTERMMAPEQILAQEYGTAVDIFSMGLILIEIMTLRRVGEDGFLTREPQTHFQPDFDAIRDAVPEDTPQSFVDLILCCIEEDPDARLQAADVSGWLENPELRQIQVQLP